MSERGVFAVDRGIWAHPLFAEEKFSEREAFLWLVSEAAFRPRRVRVGASFIDLKRGQLAHSLRFMADKWQWPEPRVRRFLGRLKNDAVIVADSDAGQTRITICNYDAYQRVSLPDDAPADAPVDAVATQDRRKEEDRKYRKDNTSETSSLRSADAPVEVAKPKPERELILEALQAVVSEDRAKAIVEHRKKIKAPLSLHAASLLAKRLAGAVDPNAAADLMIERGWRGFDPSWGPAQARASPVAPAVPQAEQDDQWRRKLRHWRERGEWRPNWGNGPDSPSFQVICPVHILREFNLERPAA
jgi:hypothetical protein